MPHTFLQGVELIQTTVSRWLATVQRRYKRNSNEIVRQELTSKVGEYKFVKSPRLADIASEAADKLLNLRYDKLQQRTSGL